MCFEKKKLFLVPSLPQFQQRHAQKWVLYEENSMDFTHAPFGILARLLSDCPLRNYVMELQIVS